MELLLGAMLVVMGAVLLLDKLNITVLDELLRYWPLALIGLGVAMLLEHDQAQRERQ